MNRILIPANLLLIAAVAYFGVKAGYRMLANRLDTEPAAIVETIQANDTEKETFRPKAHYQAIEKRNLFKTADEAVTKVKEPPPPVEDTQPLEQTKLKLKLWGTVSGTGIKKWAVIEDTKSREQELRNEGDIIQDKAVIKKILAKKIILTVDGKDEVLEMEDWDAAGGSKGAPRPPNLPFKPSSASSDPGEPKRISVARTEIEDAVSSLNNLMKQAKIRPHFKRGKPDGLTVTRIKPDSIFKTLGLRNGDIIKGVDGESIESVDDGLKFYRSLRSGSTVNLEIERRGKTNNIEYTIE